MQNPLSEQRPEIATHKLHDTDLLIVIKSLSRLHLKSKSVLYELINSIFNKWILIIYIQPLTIQLLYNKKKLWSPNCENKLKENRITLKIVYNYQQSATNWNEHFSESSQKIIEICCLSDPKNETRTTASCKPVQLATFISFISEKNDN